MSPAANQDIADLSRLIREHGLLRPRRRIYPPKPKQGVRASRPNEYWHIDVTVIKLLDGTRTYLHAIIDNFSRRILAWKLVVRLEPQTTCQVLIEAAKHLPVGGDGATVVADSGGENVNHEVDDLLSLGQLRRVLAQVEFSFCNSLITSIKVAELAMIIRARAAFLRKIIILDCCFSAAAFKEFQSGPLQAGHVKLLQEFPGRGTTLFCAASALDSAIAPRGLPRTMFSDALLRSLREGHEVLGPRFTVSELGDLVKQNLRDAYPESWVRPEVLSPDQRDGDVASMPLFPSPAHLAREQREAEARARKEVTSSPTGLRSGRWPLSPGDGAELAGSLLAPQPPGEGCVFAAAHSRGVNRPGAAATSAGEAAKREWRLKKAEERNWDEAEERARRKAVEQAEEQR